MRNAIVDVRKMSIVDVMHTCSLPHPSYNLSQYGKKFEPPLIPEIDAPPQMETYSDRDMLVGRETCCFGGLKAHGGSVKNGIGNRTAS